jgi:23S rRNA (uracil1939-C5)-methyltransferase
MEKNETFEAECTGYTEDGAGVVRINNAVVFVPGLIIGEKAEVGITLMKKTYGYGRIVKLLRSSEHRIEPKCTVFRKCGGCLLQYMDDEAQKYFKEEKVKNCFKKNAGMDIEPLPILRVEPVWNYRNKVQIPVGRNRKENKVEMGFYMTHTNQIVDYDRCLVQTDLSNEITAFLKKEMAELNCAGEVRHVLIKHAHMTGEVMVVLVAHHYPFPGSDELTAKLQESFPQIKSLSAIVNNRTDNVILDGREVLIAGRPYIEETLLDCRFRISARSFYQINPYATRVLYAKALEFAQLTGKETVIDMYCGTGTIGILASRHAKKVYGIEIVADAIKDAKINAEQNSVSNIDFVNADALKGAQAVIRSRIKADVVIVDPPRKGCSKDTLNAIIKINPKRLVYVSCDPATLARDVKIMSENGYELQKVQPVDLFPQTPHVETVVLMSRVKGK